MSKNKFKYRSAGVAIKQEHVLLCRSVDSDFWALPGGQIDPGETSADSLVREMKEELDTPVEVGRLLWVIENIYKKNQKIIHEFGLYHLMNFASNASLEPDGGDVYGNEHDRRLLFRWHSLKSLERLVVYPACLRLDLHCLPDGIRHIVCKSV